MAKLKRLLAPKFWRIAKKGKTWVVAPRPGPHKKFESMPLLIAIRDVLGLVETGQEGKAVIRKGDIFVDGKMRKDPGYPVGLMDVIAIPKLNKFYRAVPYAKGLKLIEITEKESKLKILKIKDKRLIKRGKTQLNFHDGKNLIVSKDVYRTGDSVLVQLQPLKIIEYMKLGKGALGLIIKGRNAGILAEAKDVIVSRTMEPNKVVCQSENEKLDVIMDYFLVVGEKSPLIAVGE